MSSSIPDVVDALGLRDPADVRATVDKIALNLDSNMTGSQQLDIPKHLRGLFSWNDNQHIASELIRQFKACDRRIRHVRVQCPVRMFGSLTSITVTLQLSHR